MNVLGEERNLLKGMGQEIDNTFFIVYATGISKATSVSSINRFMEV